MTMKSGLTNMVLILSFMTGRGEIEGSYFRILRNASIPNDPLQTFFSVRNDLHCVRRCHSNTGCDVALYDSEQRRCDLYSWREVTMVPITNNAVSVVMETWIPLFHARPVLDLVPGDDMTFEEAETLCGKFGARLASVMQMYGAFDDGYHLCRCGWLADESIRFSIQALDEGCYGYTVQGPNSCKQLMTKAPEAYCTL